MTDDDAPSADIHEEDNPDADGDSEDGAGVVSTAKTRGKDAGKAVGDSAQAAGQAVLAFTGEFLAGIREQPDDDSEEAEKIATAESKGEWAGDTVASTVRAGLCIAATFLFRFVYAATRILPKSSALWKNLLLKSAKAYEKRTGADALAFNARPNGTIEPLPVKWNPEGDKAKWVSKGGENEWGPGSEGRNTDRFGKANVILVDEDGVEKWETLDARVAEAIEMKDYKPLFRKPVINKYVNRMAVDVNQDGSGGAVADGGVVNENTQQITVHDPGELEDALIDVSSGDGMDGLRVSWRKFKELRTETTTTEEMQRQEDRGRIAEMQGKEELAKKMLIIAGAIIVLSLGAAFVLPKLIGGGGGGGGGGGVVPITVNALGSAKLLAGGLL